MLCCAEKLRSDTCKNCENPTPDEAIGIIELISTFARLDDALRGAVELQICCGKSLLKGWRNAVTKTRRDVRNFVRAVQLKRLTSDDRRCGRRWRRHWKKSLSFVCSSVMEVNRERRLSLTALTREERNVVANVVEPTG